MLKFELLFVKFLMLFSVEVSHKVDTAIVS